MSEFTYGIESDQVSIDLIWNVSRRYKPVNVWIIERRKSTAFGTR